MKLGFLIDLRLTFLLIVFNAFLTSSTKIRLDSVTNGYTNILLAISEGVASNEVEANLLITNIKEVLTEASALLYRATEKRLFFQQVTVLLPYHFYDVVPTEGLAKGEVYNVADIRVSAASSQFDDDNCYVLRRGDCGESGEYIHLSSDVFLRLTHSHNSARKFVSQWAQFRYGLYDESSSGSDDFYFDPIEQKFLPTLCTNQPPNGTVMNSETGLPCVQDDLGSPLEDDCTFIADPVHNDHVTSSLLYDTSLPRMSEFCNSNTHNRFAPTKQNLQCQGRSAWEVMLQHKDFYNMSDPHSKGEASTFPEFRFLTSNPHSGIVIAIDFNIRQMKRVKDAVLSASATFVLYAVPVGTKVELVFVNDTHQTAPIRSTMSHMTDRQDFVKAMNNLFYNDTDNFTISKPLHQDDTEDWSSGVVMFVVATKDLIGSWTRLTGAHFLPVFLNIAPNQQLVQIAKASEGKSFVFYGNEIEIEAGLNSALFDSSLFWDSYDIIQIDSSVIRSGEVVIRNFVVDEDLVPYVKFVLSVKDSSVSDTVLLVSPSAMYDVRDITPSSISGRMLLSFNVSASGDQSGLWSYREIRQSQFDSFWNVFAVVPRSVPTLRAFAMLDATSILMSDGEVEAPRLTLVLENGREPLETVRVIATVYAPDDTRAVTYILKDDGYGADATTNDKVYSVFLPYVMGNGIYRVVPFVYGGDGMSCVLEDQSECFQRCITSLYYEAKAIFFNETNSTDILSPIAIRDLAVVSVQHTSSDTDVQLTWSAPGDDLDHGTVVGYELLYFGDWLSASNFINGTNVTADMIVHGNLVPLPPGMKQSVTVKFPNLDKKLIFIGMRAYDDANHHGPPSNVMSVLLAKAEPGIVTNETTTLSSSSSPGWTESPNTNSTWSETSSIAAETTTVSTVTNETESSGEHVDAYDGVIASAILLSIVIVISLIICIHMKFFSKRARTQRNFSYEEFSVPERIPSRIER